MTGKVNWGAIFAGAFIGMSGMVFFSLFALATGISAVNVIEPLASTISLSAAIYTIVTAMVSFFLAGYCVTRLAGIRDAGPACLHALTSFSAAGAMVPFLFTRAMFVGAPGFAIAPAPGFYISPGLSWALFLSFSFAAISCCAGGVQACYRYGAMGGVQEDEERRAA
jgi:hypothetical protein